MIVSLGSIFVCSLRMQAKSTNLWLNPCDKSRRLRRFVLLGGWPVTEVHVDNLCGIFKEADESGVGYDGVNAAVWSLPSWTLMLSVMLFLKRVQPLPIVLLTRCVDELILADNVCKWFWPLEVEVIKEGGRYVGISYLPCSFEDRYPYD